jgi:hypothetical protein
MRKINLLLAAMILATTLLKAQTVATFEALSLAHADTFYTNFTASGTDVGFNDGLVHFPCVYDTSFGGYWQTGFAYSNMTDSVTSGFLNQYSAKTGIGYGGSSKYAVAYCYDPTTYANNCVLKMVDSAMGHPVKGCYVTNNTYAYNSMRDGDMFARKFHNGDWFKISARGYSHGTLNTDSVSIYLANFLHPDSNDNYILNTWEWFNLEPLGKVDSIRFTLTSTDNGAFGMNTPAYFCIDNFTTYESFDTTTPPTTIVQTTQPASIKAYPIPTKNTLHVDVAGARVNELTITDMAGRTVWRTADAAANYEINTADLSAGLYVLTVTSDKGKATLQFTKE